MVSGGDRSRAPSGKPNRVREVIQEWRELDPAGVLKAPEVEPPFHVERGGLGPPGVRFHYPAFEQPIGPLAIARMGRGVQRLRQEPKGTVRRATRKPPGLGNQGGSIDRGRAVQY